MALPWPLPLPEVALLIVVRQSSQFQLKPLPQVAHRWVALIEAEQPHAAQPAAHQNTLLLQPLELALGHIEAKSKRLGDALSMAFSVALQEQQD